jgi:formate--tetrahydrofolate ligase
VLVATIRGLKHHGQGDLIAGSANLLRHASHLRSYGPPVVVAINKFYDDTQEDIDALEGFCAEHGLPVVLSDPWGSGSAGCECLAQTVAEACQKPSQFHSLYAQDDAFETKLSSVVRKAYGGDSFVLSDDAKKNLEWLNKHGYGNLPICVAKTQYSLSDDPKKLNAPEEFDIRIREIRLSAGAGFLVAISGDVMLMPGLGKTPAALNIDVDSSGRITGLF